MAGSLSGSTRKGHRSLVVQPLQHLKQFKVNVCAEVRGNGWPGPARRVEGPGGGIHHWYLPSLHWEVPQSRWGRVWNILWHSLFRGQDIYLPGRGAGWTLLLDAWLSPCLCREDVSTKAHTLGRSLPSVGLVSLHLPGLPFWAPEYSMGQSPGMAEAVPVLLCSPSEWPLSTWTGVPKGDLLLQQWGVLPAFLMCVCF